MLWQHFRLPGDYREPYADCLPKTVEVTVGLVCISVSAPQKALPARKKLFSFRFYNYLFEPGQLMTDEVVIAGVDGCASGWFVVTKNVSTGECSHFIATAFRDIVTMPFAVIGVDIPIGFLDHARTGGRECDVAARKLLGGVLGPQSVCIINVRCGFLRSRRKMRED